MPKHCAALPGAANELLGSSTTAELATALLERLGVAIPAQRDRGSRHASVLHAPPSYAPRPPAALSRTPLAATALARATTARNGALARAAQAEQALRHRTPSRPTLTAMSVTAVTAVGAAAAITATGGFAAMGPTTAASPSPVAAAAALTLADASSAADTAPATVAAAAPVTAPIVTAPLANLPAAAADLPTVQVPRIVSEATATAKTLSTPDRPAAAPRKVAAAAPAHAPGGVDTPAPKATAGTGVGAAALKAAMTKIGKPYSWGAVGPNAFDCSGLMMWAFKQVGVTLPRTSAAQSTAGTAVSKADLRPGDLVFFYSPVSHVGLYLGNGKILNATLSGEPVQISNMAYMPFHNARRI
jgi:cell wall-associated NlpC family hydrolase